MTDKLLLRRGDVIKALGIGKKAFSKMIENGLLKPVFMGKKRGGRAFFRACEVRKLAGI